MRPTLGRLLHLAILAALAVLVPAGLRPALAQGAGSVRGSVYDRDFEVPLSDVRVSVVGLPLATVTSEDGNFLIEQVPAGAHTLSFTKEGYEREFVTGVVVLAGQLAEVRADLSSEVIEMEELVIMGADPLADSELGLLDIRAEALTVQDSVSTEMIGRAGVGDVAGALKLVVGASVSEGKYATVRGLSDRYTGTTVNGVRIPSTDPRRRAVQLDLFPTGTIDGLTVTKTFTPDLQGDFTGGGVNIRTKGVPDGPTLSVSMSVEHDSEATGNPDFLSYQGGGVGRWGFRADGRALPAAAAAPMNYATNPTFFPSPQQLADAEAVDRITRSFAPVMGTAHNEPGPNQGFSLVGGNRFSVRGGTLGFIGALTYSHKKESYEDGQNNLVRVSPEGLFLLPRSDNRGTDDLLMGVLGSLVWSRGERQEYGLTLIGNQAAEDVARIQLTEIGGGVEQNQSLQYTERLVGSAQLRGSHELGQDGPLGAGPVALDWLVSTNATEQDEPDVRFFRNEFSFSPASNTFTASQPGSTPFADNTRRIFREISEDSDQAAVNVALPFRQWTDLEGRVKAGVFVERGERDFTQRSFSYFYASPPGSGPAVQVVKNLRTFVTDSADVLWTDVFLDPERIGLASNRCPVGMLSNACTAPNQLIWFIDDLGNDVNYTAEQRIDAVYAMAELPLTPQFDLIAGARHETTFLEVVPVNPTPPGEVEVVLEIEGGDRILDSVPQAEAIAEIDESALLPALAGVWKPRPDMNVRLSWSRTLARPQYRELAPVATEEFLAGDEYVGNTALRVSDITNWDARWEWFRKPGEVLAASLFYKDIRDPIELISFSAAGRTLIQPVNYETGSVRGAEIETRVDLGAYAPRIQGLAAGINATWIDSEVDVPQDEQDSLATFGLNEPTRRLQGQPEYLLNLFLTYDNERTGTSAGLFYNRTGETLLTGAATGLDNSTPNVFENAFGLLDLSASQKIGKNTTVSLRARNLLQPDRGSLYRDPRESESVKVQRTTAQLFAVSLGLKW